MKRLWNKLTKGTPEADPLAADEPRSRWVYGLWSAVGVLFVLWLIGWWWTEEPEHFDIRTQVNGEAAPTGYATADTLARVAETLLEKRGGYLTNDVMPPGVWLDNIPNWEFGVIVQVRDLAGVMRNDFSRSQTQSVEDKALSRAEPAFNRDVASWIFPRAEGEYRTGIDLVRDYQARLVDQQPDNAEFFARADNLRGWLQTVSKRLGDLSQRLSASVGQRRININLAGERAARATSPSGPEVTTKTPWLEIDDVFYEARGASWALLHFLKAAEHDFAGVLEDKNARVSMQQVIRELEASQRPVYSPVVLNGSGFGFTANHSLVMASYLSRANSAVINLRELLSEG